MLLQDFNQCGVQITPQTYTRSGFEVRSYFNFAGHYDPRHDLQISIVLWRVPMEDQLQKSEHPNMDVITIVQKGQYRQDNATAENIQLKAGQSILLSNGETDCWHRDSNSSDNATELIQVYIKQQQPKLKTEMQIMNDNITTPQYQILIVKQATIIQSSEYKLAIILNLNQNLLLHVSVDQEDKQLKHLQKQYQLNYYDNQQLKQIEIVGPEVHCLIILQK